VATRAYYVGHFHSDFFANVNVQMYKGCCIN